MFEMFFTYWMSTSFFEKRFQVLSKGSTLKTQQPFSQGGPKRGNPTMTTSGQEKRRPAADVEGKM